jgi:hypothetical protein
MRLGSSMDSGVEEEPALDSACSCESPGRVLWGSSLVNAAPSAGSPEVSFACESEDHAPTASVPPAKLLPAQPQLEAEGLKPPSNVSRPPDGPPPVLRARARALDGVASQDREKQGLEVVFI